MVDRSDQSTATSARNDWCGQPGCALTTEEAAERLGIGRSHVSWLCEQGHLTWFRVGRRLWIDAQSVESEVAERDRWISIPQACRLLECKRHDIERLMTQGAIIRRPGATRGLACLDRASVEGLVPAFRAARRDAEEAKVSADREREARRSGPPLDGRVWLSVRQTALTLGISANRVIQLAESDRLPYTYRRGRRWFLREHVEQRAAARAFVARMRGGPEETR